MRRKCEGLGETIDNQTCQRGHNLRAIYPFDSAFGGISNYGRKNGLIEVFVVVADRVQNDEPDKFFSSHS